MVSLSALSRSFNYIVVVDHFFLDGVRLFHVMHATTRYSAVAIFDNLSL